MSAQIADLSRLALLLLLAANGTAQTSANSDKTITREKLVAVSKIYFRDISEFPMRMDTRLIAVKNSGKVARSKNGTADVLFRGGWKNPFGEGIGPWESFSPFSPALIFGGGIMPLAWAMGNTMSWSTAPAFLLIGDSPPYVLALVQASTPFTVKLVPRQECPVLTMTRAPKAYIPDHICGTAEVQLDEDLSFRHSDFDAAGLPAPARIEPFGKCTLQSYHVEAEFHKVMLPNDDTPFLVPRSVVVTLQTDKGKLEFTSTFERAQGENR